jgi:23S rRNA (adenine2503-C2)-methyltransferase
MTDPVTPAPAPRLLPVARTPRDPRPGIAGLDEGELADLVGDLGQPTFRARQVGDAVWRSGAASWDEVTTLARPFRATLAERFRFDTVGATTIRAADGDTTEKALHGLSDGRLVESVLMHYPAGADRRERNTLCISSQAGCAVGCPFCATGELGFDRDLEVAEIVDQARHARRRMAATGRHLTNVVFMGMGEPLLVLDAVLGAVAALTDPARFALGSRHITISTSGVVPGIERLTRLRPQWTLAISLHAARDPLRDLLVPLNRRWPVADVVAAARAYGEATGRRVSYEYVMIDGINDTPADADALVRLLRGSGAHVNCIPMNPVAHTPWRASTPARTSAFADRLRAGGLGVTVRRNRGQEVGAACGQLAAEQAGEPPAPTVARRRELLEAASAAALRGERSVEPAPAGLGPGGRAPGRPARPGPARRGPARSGPRRPAAGSGNPSTAFRRRSTPPGGR